MVSNQWGPIDPPSAAEAPQNVIAVRLPSTSGSSSNQQSAGPSGQGAEGSAWPSEEERRAQEYRLRMAADEGDADTIELLLKGSTIGKPRPAVHPDAAAPDGGTALMYAVLGERLEAATVLLKRGARVDRRNLLGDGALQMCGAVETAEGAAKGGGNGSSKMIKLLLAYNPDVDHQNVGGERPLPSACLPSRERLATTGGTDRGAACLSQG